MPIAEPEPVQDHRYHRCSHTHTAAIFSCEPIEPFSYSCFFADSCYDPQMIQSLRLILHFLGHFRTPPRFFATLRQILFSVNPSAECGLSNPTVYINIHPCLQRVDYLCYTGMRVSRTSKLLPFAQSCPLVVLVNATGVGYNRSD